VTLKECSWTMRSSWYNCCRWSSSRTSSSVNWRNDLFCLDAKRCSWLCRENSSIWLVGRCWSAGRWCYTQSNKSSYSVRWLQKVVLMRHCRKSRKECLTNECSHDFRKSTGMVQMWSGNLFQIQTNRRPTSVQLPTGTLGQQLGCVYWFYSGSWASIQLLVHHSEKQPNVIVYIFSCFLNYVCSALHHAPKRKNDTFSSYK